MAGAAITAATLSTITFDAMYHSGLKSLMQTYVNNHPNIDDAITATHCGISVWK
jgi:hypothetical protein